MGDPEARRSFPDSSQRAAFCHAQWRRKSGTEKKLSDSKAELHEVTKLDAARQQVFGFFNMSVKSDGEPLVDLQDDLIDPATLEQAAYDFVLKSRAGGEMHQGDPVATLIESFVATPEKLEAMGLPSDAIPAGWWGGFQVHDRDVWKRVADGELKMFSIQGRGERVEVD
jgi:hypothetical protein